MDQLELALDQFEKLSQHIPVILEQLNRAVCKEMLIIKEDIFNIYVYAQNISEEYKEVYEPIERLIVDLENDIHDLNRNGRVYSAIHTDVQQIILSYKRDVKGIQLIYEDINHKFTNACNSGCKYVSTSKTLRSNEGFYTQHNHNKDSIETNLKYIYKSAEYIVTASDIIDVIDKTLNKTGVTEKVRKLKESVLKYGGILKLLHINITEIIGDIDNQLHSCNERAFQLEIVDKINTLQYIKNEINNVKIDYARFHMTKYDIVQRINATMMRKIKDVMTYIKKSTKNHVLPLWNSIDTLIVKTSLWHWKLFEALAPLHYYPSKWSPEEEVKKMKIWLEPQFEINSAKLMKYRYSESNMWQYWPTSRKILSLLEHDNRLLIQDIIACYANGMEHMLSRVDYDIEDSMDNANDVMKDLMTEHDTYGDLCKIGKEFIK